MILISLVKIDCISLDIDWDIDLYRIFKFAGSLDARAFDELRSQMQTQASVSWDPEA